MRRGGRSFKLAGALATLAAQPVLAAEALEARWDIGGEPLILGSGPGFAGAVSSLRFRGVEHLDAADHGRLLQGAISFDGQGECLNPTQAGASSDPPGRTTSRLLFAEAGPAGYRTVTRMAYWLRPGQTCRDARGLRPAANRDRLSDVTYDQQLTPGWRGQSNAIHHRIVFTTRTPRASAVVEALTAYTPAGFSAVLFFDPVRRRLERDLTVRDRPGEQDRVAVLATPDGRSALALLSPDPAARYGRFTYPETNKLNVVFRPEGPYRPGAHAYQAVTVIGTAAEVTRTLDALTPQPPPTLEERLRRAWRRLLAWVGAAAQPASGALALVRAMAQRLATPFPLIPANAGTQVFLRPHSSAGSHREFEFPKTPGSPRSRG